MKTVLLGITSSIAAFKSLELIRLLRDNNVRVVVIMTKNAASMISPGEFEKASGNRVYVELFEKGFDYKKILQEKQVEHIALADSASILAIVPTTANMLAKLAHGIADDYLTTTTLAATAPILLAPAMNVHMWHNAIVQENVRILTKRGYHIVEPTKGMLACGYEGQGKLEEVKIIYHAISLLLSNSTKWTGKKVIVSAGGTKEYIDDVRFISNNSSGKMGVALANALSQQGADVILLRATNSAIPISLMREYEFRTSEDLLRLVRKYTKKADFFFHTAAVGDFAIKKQLGKISSNKTTHIVLTPQKKIIDEIKKINPAIFLTAFKAEHTSKPHELITSAKKKLLESDAQLIVANDISRTDRGFGSDSNEVYLVTAQKPTKHVPLGKKHIIAEHILDYVLRLSQEK